MKKGQSCCNLVLARCSQNQIVVELGRSPWSMLFINCNIQQDCKELDLPSYVHPPILSLDVPEAPPVRAQVQDGVNGWHAACEIFNGCEASVDWSFQFFGGWLRWWCGCGWKPQ